jgi:branched-chain amino acid transport system permease protein
MMNMTTQQTPPDQQGQDTGEPGRPPLREHPAAIAFLRAWNHPRWGLPVRIAVAYVAFVEIALQLAFGRIDLGLFSFGRMTQPVPYGIILHGAVVGSLYALVAIGLILIYRANRIINFAQAGLGAVPAVLGLVLITNTGAHYFVGLAVMLLTAPLLGAAVNTTVIRRFESSPRLILTVATIGLVQVLAFFELIVPRLLTGEGIPVVGFPSPFQGFRFSVGVVRFSGDSVVTLLVVGAVVAGLAAFFRYTDMGIAVRASAENAERALMVGIPVRRVATVVWALAALLSGIGVFLRAPLVGLPIGGLIGPSVLLFGLAAAVIARMNSLPTAFLAGMAIGVIDQTSVFVTRRTTLATAIMLLVILVALLVQRGSMSRAVDAAKGTWDAVREFRPVPPELRQVREVVLVRRITYGLIAAAALGAPWIVGAQRIGFATLIVLYAMVGVSLVILSGWSGQISLGQFAFAGVGAAVAGGLAANYQLDFFFTLIVGGLAGAAVAILIGLPALRIQGLFLAVTTVAFAFTVHDIVLNPEFFGWLLPADMAFVERPVLYGVFDVSSSHRFYFVCLFFLGLTLAAARAFRRNRAGRIMIGARDNEKQVQTYGVNLASSRLAVFAISGFMAAVAGALLAYQQGSVEQAAFRPLISLELFAMVVIGGMTSLIGPVLGALYVLGIPFFLEDHIDNISLLATGAGLLVLLMFLPGGLAEAVYRVRDTFLRWVADKHGIHVPSLVADDRVEDSAEADESMELAAAGIKATPERSAGGMLAAETDPDAGGEPMIECPSCSARLPLSEAPYHRHFQSFSSNGDTSEQEDES